MRDGIGKGMAVAAVIAMAMTIAIAVLLAGLPGATRAQVPPKLGKPTGLTAVPVPGFGDYGGGVQRELTKSLPHPAGQKQRWEVAS